jgi:hypothetical protein
MRREPRVESLKSQPGGEPIFMTSLATAKLISIKPQTLQTWRMQGKGPAYIRLGSHPQGRVLYERADVTAWLEARKHRSTAEETVLRGAE